MSNILDYLDWRGDLAIDRRAPFCEVDNLILTQLSFIDLVGIADDDRLRRSVTLREAAARYLADPKAHADRLGVLIPNEVVGLLEKAAASRRFGDMRLLRFENTIDEKLQTQFAALCIVIGDGSFYISFRGTDDTLVGWKENFNMGFMDSVPAQLLAAQYTEAAARAIRGKIRIGGHSKGGNLAVYSAAKSSGEIQERIVAVHNNDGPGFAWDISETPGHKRIANRIHTILPQTSVVGMLMEHEKRYQVVHSTYDGLYQHDGFSWQVLGTQFVHLDDFSREGKLVDETLSSWADSLNTQQREALADALYSVFTASGAKTLSELTEEKLKSAAAMLKTYKNLDRETRRMVTEAFMLFFKLGTKNFVLDTQEEGSREIENIRKKISEQYQKLVERKK